MVAALLSRGERVRSSSDELAKAWAEFLAPFPFQWFCGFTFRDHVHPEAADKKWRLWISKLNRSLYGPRWYRKSYTSVFHARALEWQKRGVLHYHALIGDVCDINTQAMRYMWEREWSDLAGFADIQPIKPGQESEHAVRAYCSKYVAKGGELELSASLRWYLQPVRELQLG